MSFIDVYGGIVLHLALVSCVVCCDFPQVKSSIHMFLVKLVAMRRDAMVDTAVVLCVIWSVVASCAGKLHYI